MNTRTIKSDKLGILKIVHNQKSNNLIFFSTAYPNENRIQNLSASYSNIYSTDLHV